MKRLNTNSIRVLKYYGSDVNCCYIKILAKTIDGEIIDRKVKIQHHLYNTLSRLGHDNEKNEKRKLDFQRG